MEIDLGRSGHLYGGARTLLAEAPVDPGAGKAGAFGWHMVVVKTLGRMQDLGFANAEIDFEMLEQIVEVAWIGLIGTNILGRVDGIERDTELLVAGGEALAIDNAQDDVREEARAIRGDLCSA